MNSLGTVGFVTHEHFLPSRADCAVHLGVTIETYVTMEISRFMSMGSLDWTQLANQQTGDMQKVISSNGVVALRKACTESDPILKRIFAM